ncbi:MAG: hypothetical protein PSN35_07230 [Candidatus Thioglobus sp.]|uniref:hypothetical protein n=1 Tax=Candidatus Thioglobus sp. TaxID=2026721 RepID=UPI002623765F|nr:hypothetical protein [Candidatus Thioglobus sp.]MDC9727609.1 hypothetical protein [Candidatus Thioglobus sp.]
MNNFLQELDSIFLIKNSSFGSSVKILSRKSFTAYIVPMGVWFFAWLISMAISGFLGFLMTLAGVYIFLHIRSYVLFMDDKGLWVFRGVFSWQRGFYGVKWVDFDESLFYQNFASWALRSFTILVKNKYKKEVEIELKYMHDGDKVVHQINNFFLSR